MGDACGGDKDGDGVADTEDFCPRNPAMVATSFTPYQVVYLDPSMVTGDTLYPDFRINHDGKEVLMTQPTDLPFILLGMHIFPLQPLLIMNSFSPNFPDV